MATVGIRQSFVKLGRAVGNQSELTSAGGVTGRKGSVRPGGRSAEEPRVSVAEGPAVADGSHCGNTHIMTIHILGISSLKTRIR